MSVIVRVEHLRAEFLCVFSARAWFRDRNLDFGAFLHDGIPVEELEAMDDWFAQRVAARARKEAESGQL